MPVWEIPDKASEDLKEGFEWFIIEGTRYNRSQSDEIKAATRVLIGDGGSRRAIDVFHNYTTMTAKYTEA